MKKWSRKKAQLSFFLSLFSIFTLSSFLLSTHKATNGQVGPTHEKSSSSTSSSSKLPSFPTFSLTTNFSPSSSQKANNLVLNALDWTKACSSTREYNGQQSSTLQQRGDSIGRREETCDLFSGRWVYDDVSHPLYDEAGCPYMSDQLACTKHGRPDTEYQKWRWQPHGCDLKRWNGTDMLEKLRGKRLMFVGDSLDRGQWISMVCLLQSLIPADKKSMSPNAPLTIFRAEEYNASVEFYWAPLIVESNSDDPVNHRFDHRIIRPDALLKHASEWEKADILVFNSYLWWRSGTKIKLLWNAEDIASCQEADGLDAMKLALETWAGWVASRMNTLKQRAFFVTMSPTHLWSREWNPGSEGNCFQEKLPIVDKEGYWGSGSDVDTMRMVRNTLEGLGSKVLVLNITQLSEYRKDGHPSIYRKFWETFSPQQLSKPASYADCIHWCLPGVPDVWNELLFNLL
ncbi:protein trichome birefringence-like 1 [Iris pallida]|uniref:Protein trichome birefringence-like 1 n=1 Tax=Iris pallida TaxID=29817 RepID=A0AAX6E3Q2_IRIPA|nr:protein trichome birefringence-like 1 [Iris pallida]